MQVIPAVDVLGGRVVRLMRGDYEEVTDYGADPAAVAARWADEGASLVHVVDLEGARSGGMDAGLWRALGAAGVPFQAGGGLRTAADATAAVAAGAARVVVGTAAVWDPDALGSIAAAIGPGRVVAALDVRGGRALGSGWREDGRSLGDVLAGLAAAGVVRALVTAVVRDGTMQGPDIDLLAGVRRAAPGLALIASGGVGSLDDVRMLAASGVEGVIVGRALYEGVFTFAEAQAAASTGPPPRSSPG